MSDSSLNKSLASNDELEEWVQLAQESSNLRQFIGLIVARQQSNYSNAFTAFKSGNNDTVKVGKISDFITNPDILVSFPDADVVFSIRIPKRYGSGVYRPASQPEAIFLNIADYGDEFLNQPSLLDATIAHEATHLLHHKKNRAVQVHSDTDKQKLELAANKAEVFFGDPQNRDNALQQFFTKVLNST